MTEGWNIDFGRIVLHQRLTGIVVRLIHGLEEPDLSYSVVFVVFVM